MLTQGQYTKAMNKLIFREEQALRQSFIPWIIVLVWIFLAVFFGIGFYKQLYLGKPFGDDPTSDQQLLWTGIGTIIFMGVIFVLLLNVMLVTEVWTDGIRYKLTPFMRNLKFIPLDDIDSVQVEKYRPILEFGGWGIRRRLFSRKTAYNFSGNIGLRITRKNGSQLMLGTRKQKELQQAIEKMKTPVTEKYLS